LKQAGLDQLEDIDDQSVSYNEKISECTHHNGVGY